MPFEGGCRPLAVRRWYCEVIIVPCHGKMGRLICHETKRKHIIVVGVKDDTEVISERIISWLIVTAAVFYFDNFTI